MEKVYWEAKIDFVPMQCWDHGNNGVILTLTRAIQQGIIYVYMMSGYGDGLLGLLGVIGKVYWEANNPKMGKVSFALFEKLKPSGSYLVLKWLSNEVSYVVP